MKIIKVGDLSPMEFTCDVCNTVFEADMRDYIEKEFRFCSIPPDRGYPKEVVEQHTTVETERGVYCPVCKKFICLSEGKIEKL